EWNVARVPASAQYLTEGIDHQIIVGLGVLETHFRVLALHLGEDLVGKDVRVAGGVDPTARLEHGPRGIAALWIVGHAEFSFSMNSRTLSVASLVESLSATGMRSIHLQINFSASP